MRSKERKREREKEKRGAKGEERRTCFPRRNPRVSDLDSAYQVGEILEALSSSRFLSSLPLNSPPRVNFAPSPPLPFSSSSRFFFFFFSSLFLPLSFFLSRIPGVRTCGRKAFSSVVSSREYLSSLDYQQLPFFICTTICCVSHEYINYLLAFFRVFTRS